MRFLKDFVVLGLCLSLLSRVSSLDICQLTHGNDAALHTSYKDDGIRLCCKTKICPEGSEAVLCIKNDPTSTDCRPCPSNTFQSHPTSSVDMKYCQAKQTCRAGMKVADDDSRVKDRRCLCDLEKGFCNPSRNRSMYCQRKYCPVGKELDQDCGCIDCPDGFFKDVNGSMPCRPWRNCRDEGRKRIVKGSNSTDAVCSNNTDVREGGASSSTTKPLKTKVFSENSSTSVFPAVHSMESQHNSSDLNHTTVKTETSYNWIPYVFGIIVFLTVPVLVILLCLKTNLFKRICAGDMSDKPPAPHQVKDLKTPLINYQNGKGLPVKENTKPLKEGEGRCQARHQNEDCTDEEKEVAVAPDSVEDPLSVMTCAMQKSIQNNLVMLTENLIINHTSLLSVLCTNGTITNQMKEKIQAKSTPSSMNEELLDFLLKRPCLSYRTFVFALVYTKQSYLAKLINAPLAEEYQAYVDGEGKVEDKVLSFGRL